MDSSSMKYASYPGGHTEGFPDASKQLFNNVYENLLNKNKKDFDFPTFEDECRELCLCDAIKRSSLKNIWEKVDNK